MVATATAVWQEASIVGQFSRGARNERLLRKVILEDLTRQYQSEAQKFFTELGGQGKFKLEAKWKQKNLERKARVMSKALSKTMAKEEARIMQLPAGERKAARAAMRHYKQGQLRGLLRQEAVFQAKTDMLVHSGVINPQKAQVMYFRNEGPRPCMTCIGIEGGNPYTVEDATTLGAAAHPNCLCSWQQGWEVDQTFLNNTKRQVADGEVRLWQGRGRTPAQGRAVEKTALMQEFPGNWTTRRAYQVRVAGQRHRRKREAAAVRSAM